MKKHYSRFLLLGLVVLVGVGSGCVAIPPLISVNEKGDTHLHSRLDDLERRVKNLEAAQNPK